MTLVRILPLPFCFTYLLPKSTVDGSKCLLHPGTGFNIVGIILQETGRVQSMRTRWPDWYFLYLEYICTLVLLRHTDDPGHISPWNYLLLQSIYAKAMLTISDFIQSPVTLMEISPWIRSLVSRAQIRTLGVLPVASMFTSNNFILKSPLSSVLSQTSQASLHSLKTGFERKSLLISMH